MQAPPSYVPPMSPKPSNTGKILIIVAVIGGLLLVLGSTLAVLAVYGVRKYIANAKAAEAKNALGQIAKDAAQAYESGPARRMCPSATQPVPALRTLISGKKYQSRPADWEVDQATNAGFACLRFEMSMPQYYQYDYAATTSSFTGFARGDLNGDGHFSEFQVLGTAQNGKLVLSPSLVERTSKE